MGIQKEILIRFSVWTARLIAGSCFIISAFSKGIDPWGTIFKFEQYFSVWGFHEPRSLLLAMAVGLCILEFLVGVSLFAGMYRNSAPKVGFVLILFFLLLTGYILIYSPVDDCGCFGDMLKISNTATFIKNIILALLILFLLKYNCRCRGIFTPLMQWLVVTFSILYIIALGIIGYLVQPLIDFRPFREGKALLDSGTENIRFIYEKNGEKSLFAADDLPSPDSGWIYVGRKDDFKDSPRLFIENAYGDDVTDEVIPETGDLLLIITPEVKRGDVSTTMYLNRIAAAANKEDIPVISIIGGTAEDIEKWKDLSMASYPIYLAEDSQLKTLARGETSLVMVHDGIISEKISLSIISNGLINKLEKGNVSLNQFLSFNQSLWLTRINVSYLIVLLLCALPTLKKK